MGSSHATWSIMLVAKQATTATTDKRLIIIVIDNRYPWVPSGNQTEVVMVKSSMNGGFSIPKFDYRGCTVYICT